MGNKVDICHDTKTTFVGQIKNKKFHGQGTLYYNETGDLYKGMFQNGVKHGSGELQYYNGDKYIGDFYQDAIQGKGKYISNNGYIYEGNFTVGTLLGEGKIFNINEELLYEGEFLNSLPHGFGISYLDNSVSYVGLWNRNFYHGHGLLIENTSHKYGLYQKGILIEKINKIPQKFYKYIKKPILYDSNVKLTTNTKSKHNFPIQKLKPKKSILSANIPTSNTIIPAILPTPTPLKIIENPFNCILLNPINLKNKVNNIFDNKSSEKSTFYPINTRY
jgi:hypothetical protein